MQRIDIKIQGGLGNQLFQLIFAEHIKKQRPIADIHFDLTYFQLPDSWPLTVAPLVSDKCKMVIPTFFDHLYWKTLGRRRIFHDHSFGAKPLTDGRSFFDGYWQDLKFFDAPERSGTVQKLLALRKSYRAQLPEALALDLPVVAVHVRRGDYLSNPEFAKVHGVQTTDYYQQSLALVREKIGPFQTLFFSDDHEFLKANFKNPIIFHGSGDSKDALSEMLVMSCCDHFIIANSTYSWWAAYLGSVAQPSAEVVAPSKWFLAQNAPKILMPNWALL